MKQPLSHLQEPVMTVARTDLPKMSQDISVQQALDEIRLSGIGEKIVYFYVVDAEDRLVGVVPTRRLLTAPLGQKLSEIMIDKVITIPEKATILEAYEFFVFYKFLAFPVVDQNHRILGVVDIGGFTDDVFDLADREHVEELFESIGFSVATVKEASPFRAFRFRLPWLLATIGSGIICAFLASNYEVTIAGSIVLAFFLTLVLGLGESVSMQSMTVTIHALRAKRPTLFWYLRAFLKETGTALMLGATCGTVVGSIVWFWRGNELEALAIGGSIMLALCGAGFFGLTIPVVLHALRLDPKIAAGPLTLAITDISTLLFYFSIAAFLL